MVSQHFCFRNLFAKCQMSSSPMFLHAHAHIHAYTCLTCMSGKILSRRTNIKCEILYEVSNNSHLNLCLDTVCMIHGHLNPYYTLWMEERLDYLRNGNSCGTVQIHKITKKSRNKICGLDLYGKKFRSLSGLSPFPAPFLERSEKHPSLSLRINS